jgi:hypothetical protein
LALSAVQQPFPELTALLSSIIFPAIPDSSLGGSAPQLSLREVPFPEILKLLFVLQTDLVDLRLVDIPLFSLISPEPEATVTCPSTVDKTLTGKDAPNPARTIFPALTLFRVRGISDYSEDLLSRIEAPGLS